MIKFKICDGCDNKKLIWKRYKGKRYCQYCWNNHPDNKPKSYTKTSNISINKVSKKKAIEDKIYSQLRRVFLNKNPFCKIRSKGCQIRSSDVHHKYIGSSRHKYYLITTSWISSCRNCHDYVHLNIEESEALGFIIRD